MTMPPITPNDTLLVLNETIKNEILSPYLDLDFNWKDSDSEGDIDIIFNLPIKEDGSTGIGDSENVVSVFLYQVEEDLNLRTGESRRYDAITGKLLPGAVSIKCNYIITYWGDDESTTTFQGPRSQTMRINNRIINALINNRSVPGIENSYARVLPPAEQLNSMSNFWQSMGDKPRLCLGYEVTIPLTLAEKPIDDSLPPVQTLSGYISGSL